MTFRFKFLERRPIVIAIAGSNGAGKSTFFASHLAESGLRFINADDLAAELAIDVYEAAEITGVLRETLVDRGESFIFETVLSDPVGEKVRQFADYIERGYEVVLIFIQIADVQMSIERVSMRAMQGGHDIPDEKLLARFGGTRANLRRAIACLPHVLVFDNSDLDKPYQLVEHFENGRRTRPGG